MRLTIVAEDESDYDVLKAITRKYLPDSRLGFDRRLAGGCGRLRKKLSAWIDDLVRRGECWVAVVHDLDDEQEAKLRTRLEALISPNARATTVVLIPQREIEAWLLYDAMAITSVFGGNRRPVLPPDPEGLPDPKQHLQRLIKKHFGQVYLCPVHNKKVAENLELRHLGRAGSFQPLPPFLDRIDEALKSASTKRPKKKATYS